MLSGIAAEELRLGLCLIFNSESGFRFALAGPVVFVVLALRSSRA
jgi:hypothetical protein